MRLKDKHMSVAKDVLKYLSVRQGNWTSLWDLYFVGCENEEHCGRKIGRVFDVAEAMPLDWKRRKRLSLMRVLYRNNLVGGCDCGCRGDFEITDDGLEFINEKRTQKYTGY